MLKNQLTWVQKPIDMMCPQMSDPKPHFLRKQQVVKKLFIDAAKGDLARGQK